MFDTGRGHGALASSLAAAVWAAVLSCACACANMTDASISAADRVVRRLEFITLSPSIRFRYRLGMPTGHGHPVFSVRVTDRLEAD